MYICKKINKLKEGLTKRFSRADVIIQSFVNERDVNKRRQYRVYYSVHLN